MMETFKVAVKYNKKLFVKFFVSLAVCVLLTVSIFALSSAAMPADVVAEGGLNSGETSVISEEPAPNETSALYDLIGIDASQPLEIILLITILSVAPSILLMMTSFTRIIIVFGFLRNAMNTQTTPPNQVLVGLALFLTMFIMWPVFSQINAVAYRPYSNGEITAWEAVEKAGEPLKEFMLKQTTNSNMLFFMNLAQATVYDTDEEGNQVQVFDFSDVNFGNYQEQLSFRVVIPAFMISELSRAFQMGFMLFIPFLIIDIVVSSTLMSMGMMMLPPAMISLPFKIMIFVIVDGWQMLVGTLITSFNP
ncbi:MAG: flagellar type III secretion system pore protein FliP [Oscillospiraceae bacterium]|jgi:flagellar biosynthetic protein FliP|nr:flagellar type III secretion system pore protein FliP [Oscillospiraceae bacterium]